MKKYVCVHGHFYQPPRDNPWLEDVELQDSAYPYHDWNERITAECYEPNSASRILDHHSHIIKIVNNYARMNFNFGPTLLSWMAEHEPPVYQAILRADKHSQQLFNGHGSAIAQAYNHIIMPLANRQDKYTQIIWGIRDFEKRFGRFPEGMWLPETAVDTETLDIMAECGIKFTILAQSQAGHIRPKGSKDWIDVTGGHIDPRYGYYQKLPSGNSINILFYDGPMSLAVAFEGLLKNGETFANRLLDGFSQDSDDEFQLVHIATDGETYGHHHRHGDMALAFAMDHISAESDAEIINYARFLELHPPQTEVSIIDNTSWSCAHGIERWRSDCGCHIGSPEGWNQQWRYYLRQAFDWLRDALIEPFEKQAGQHLQDPWQARDDYIDVIDDRRHDNIESFLKTHQNQTLTYDEQVEVLKLLELQRHAMVMYTSCGWFFDDISGIESTQVIQYAGRVVQLAEELFNEDYETPFLNRLEQAKSNIPDKANGKKIYETVVRPMRLTLEKVAAHYAISSLFVDYDRRCHLYCYHVRCHSYHYEHAGRVQLALGKATFQNKTTLEEACYEFGVLHHGDQNINCALRICQQAGNYQDIVQRSSKALAHGDFASVDHLFDDQFDITHYTLNVLFRDHQRSILQTIMKNVTSEAEGMFRHFYDNHITLIRYMGDLNIPLPKSLLAVTDFVLNYRLKESLQQDPPDMKQLDQTLSEIRHLGIELEQTEIAVVLEQAIKRLMHAFYETPENKELMERCRRMLERLPYFDLAVDLWREQNEFYNLVLHYYPSVKEKAQQNDNEAQSWCEAFRQLGKLLNVRVDEP